MKTIRGKTSTSVKTVATSVSRAASLSFFFGAGAEVAYGLPTGGRFALEVVRRAKDPVEDFKADRTRIAGACTPAYRKWLPSDLTKRSISKLGKAEHGRIFEDSLRTGYSRAVVALDNYDASAKAFLARHGVTQSRLDALFRDASGGGTFGAETFKTVKVSEAITQEPVRLFGSPYFSAIISLARDGTNQAEMTALARATMQFYLGAHGQGAMDAMAVDPLQNVPSGNPAFDELGRLFDVNPVDAGVAAFDEVMNYQAAGPVDATAAGFFRSLAIAVLEGAIEQFLDYRTTLDELLPALYRPRDSWAKFTKINLFLRATREYVLEQQKVAHGKADGYYHDLAAALASGQFTAVRVGTSNYTDLCETAIRSVHTEPVIALNGSLGLYLDPYKNAIVAAKDVATVPRFLVPFLFTQSGVKPLTSVDISRQYVTFYDSIVSSDAIVVAGFGFNADDGHINALFRQAVDEEAKHLIALQFTTGGAFDAATARTAIAENLRVDDASRITVLPIDGNRRVNGQSWTDAVLTALP